MEESSRVEGRLSEANIKLLLSLSLQEKCARGPAGLAALGELKLKVVIWLHGRDDTGPVARVGLKTVHEFTKSYMSRVKWLFPTAPTQTKYGADSPSWFDISEIPLSAQSPYFKEGVLKAVSSVHSMIDKEVKAGTCPDQIFVCGFSQGGALALASAMLYPEKLAGVAVFSGWVPLNPNFIKRIPAKSKMTNVLWLHGMSDKVVDISAGQAGPPLLEHAGVHCNFKAYPGIGHYISQEELVYFEEWFGAQLLNSSSS